MRDIRPILRSCFAAILLFVLDLSVSAISRAADIMPTGPAFEQVLDDIPISSAGVLQGAFVQASSGRADINRISVRLPSESGELLCVQIKSQDGRYEARRAFTVSGVAPGAYEIQMGLRQTSFVARYPESAIALIAGLDDSCPGYRSTTRVILAAWPPGRMSGANFILLINAGQNDAYVSFVDRSGKRRLIECRDIRNSIPRVVFSKSCSIPLIDLGHQSAVSVDEYNFGEFVRSTEFIILPDQ